MTLHHHKLRNKYKSSSDQAWGLIYFGMRLNFKLLKSHSELLQDPWISSVLPWMTACLLILEELMLSEWSLPLGWGLGGWRILFQPVKNNFSKSVVFATPLVWASECEASFGDGLPTPFLDTFAVVELFQLRLTLCRPTSCSAPGSVHGISQARTLEWAALTPGDLPDPGIEPESLVSPALAGGFFPSEPPEGKPPRGPLDTLKHSHSLSHSAPCFIWGISEILLLTYTSTFLFYVSPEEQGFVLCSLPAPRTGTGPHEAFWAIYQTTEFGIWILL